MKDQANREWLLAKKNKISFAITLAFLVVSSLISFMLLKPVQAEDFMISQDMASYIQVYGVTVDEYGVE